MMEPNCVFLITLLRSPPKYCLLCHILCMRLTIHWFSVFPNQRTYGNKAIFAMPIHTGLNSICVVISLPTIY